MKAVELHIIQNFSPSCLNRDENDIPKTAMFGGKNRARVSSQCWKRSARFYPAFVELCDNVGMPLSSRSWRSVKRFYDVLMSDKFSYTEKDARKTAIEIASVFTNIKDVKKIKDKDVADILTDNALFLSGADVEEIASIAHDALEGKKSIKSALKGYQFKIPTPDVALNGRMLASGNIKNMDVDAASQWAHIISTNAIEQELDWFIAMDDLKPDETPGADMMGDIGFNSPCFYRYMNINLDKLMEHYEALEDEAAELVKNITLEYTNAVIKSIPTAKQTSMAAQNPPSLVLVVIKENGTPISLTNAFAKPISPTRGNSLVENSIEALDTYWGKLTKSGYIDGVVEQIVLEIEGIELPNLSGSKVDSLSELMKKMEDSLPI